MDISRWASLLSAAALVSIGCSSSTVEPAADAAAAVDLGVADAGARTDQGVAPDRGAPDVGAPAACGGTLGACNVVFNTGCAVGAGCYAGRSADGGVGASCAPAGSRGWGEACTTANGCREGFACLGTPGTCVKLCCENDNASCRDEGRGGRPGAICAGSVNGSDIRTCMGISSCDLLATTGNSCPADRPRCDIIASDGTTNCFPREAGATAGGDGVACCTNSRCEPGFICVPRDPAMGMAACVPASPNRVCRRTCDPSMAGADAGAQCPASQACTISFTDAPSTYGACAPSA
jgi:hypothetical protein